MESLRAENEAITKYEFNKEQIALSLPLYLLRSLPLLLFTKSEKNDVSLSASPLQFWFYISDTEVDGRSMALFQRPLNGFFCMKSFCFHSKRDPSSFFFFFFFSTKTESVEAAVRLVAPFGFVW